MPENGLYIWTRDVRAGTGNLHNKQYQPVIIIVTLILTAMHGTLQEVFLINAHCNEGYLPDVTKAIEVKSNKYTTLCISKGGPIFAFHNDK